MVYSLVINSSPHEVRVGLVEDDVVVELLLERRKDAGLVGNVYKGRVTRVLPGMQAAFVDIGLERAAFLYVADVADTRASSTLTEARVSAGQRPIQSLLNEGQEIMVQVAKEPIGTKGARITSQVSLAGRHLVFMPNIEHIGISRRIGDEDERLRLRGILEELVPHGGGFVARTAAEGRSPEELRADLEFLRHVWNDILTRMESGSAPMTLYEDLDLVLRSARDLVTPDLNEIVVDCPAEHDRLVRFIQRFMPRYADRVRLTDRAEPIFEGYGIEAELNRALARKVWLPSGGYLIIDQTEALTAIDVNTGRFVGKRNLEDTIVKTNLEATTELVRQLRLRNIGGIIIIDFIDMEREPNRDRVFSELSLALEADRAKTNILKISELGLVEMTRKRVRESLVRSVSEPCFYCDGTALLKSRTTVIHDAYRALVREAGAMESGDVRLSVHPRVAGLLLGDEQSILAELEDRTERQISVEARPDFHLERYEFSAIDASNQPVGRRFTPHDTACG